MLRQFKIQHRLIGTFLVVSILPILFLGYYSYQLYSESINDKLSKSTFQALSLVNKNLLAELQNYQFLCGSISTNEFVQENLSKGLKQEPINEKAKEDAMDAIFRTIFPSHVINVSIFDAEHRLFYELGFETVDNHSLVQAMRDVDANAPYDGLTYVKTMRSYDTVVLGRKIHAMEDSTVPIGYAFIFISGDLFSKNILSSVNLGTGSKMMIMGRDGTVLSANDEETPLGGPYLDPELIRQIKDHQQQDIHSFSLQVNGAEQQVSYIYNEQIGWYLISLLPFSYINSETSKITVSMTIIMILMVICCIIIISFMSSSIVKPIKKIISFCNQISTGNFSSRIKDDKEDEMAILSYKINMMVDEIEHLMQNQKLDQKRKRELELQMLQSQINPHFLFNTLNTLRWLAIINHVPVLSNGISSLSELLRSTILDRDEQITIRQELENLSNYFEIQKIRYADSFQVEYDLDEKLLDCLIPKLILQPVAENAIIHGLSEHSKAIEIRISVQQQEELICIEITDNGKGFDTSAVQETDRTSNKKLSGIGITNVDERIKLYYGESYGLFITSIIGEGTCCRIIIPVQKTP
ncbi:sensor histidine kinase [Paenibacillus aceti]|uniref:HAMP domain-containing protein n=1 Tax=Paenibacillus aceti TaxID=1820010 RepID=A0ABQ1VVJ3_9BACL|nr:sensor histidine kinase [Paenibacillus aceti]GGG01286.1 hypothetical protein GCM10010913_23800 [Paenibacillus aceti]